MNEVTQAFSLFTALAQRNALDAAAESESRIRRALHIQVRHALATADTGTADYDAMAHAAIDALANYYREHTTAPPLVNNPIAGTYRGWRR